MNENPPPLLLLRGHLLLPEGENAAHASAFVKSGAKSRDSPLARFSFLTENFLLGAAARCGANIYRERLFVSIIHTLLAGCERRDMED